MASGFLHQLRTNESSPASQAAETHLYRPGGRMSPELPTPPPLLRWLANALEGSLPTQRRACLA